jgi:hypothetical protein
MIAPKIDDEFAPTSAHSSGVGWVPPLLASLDLRGLARCTGPWRDLDGDEIALHARATTAPDGRVELLIAKGKVTRRP